MIRFGQTVAHRTRITRQTAIFFVAAVAGVTGRGVRAQEFLYLPQRPPPPQQEASTKDKPTTHDNTQNGAPTCIQPAPMVRLEDYDGPLKKVVGTFARQLERKAVHPPNYKPGARLCTLKLKDKFVLFVQNSFDPVTFLSVGFNAGLDHAENSDSHYGQGAEGYGRRFGAEFVGQASSTFFKDFAYPTIFSEDPRYYRLARGPAGKRLLHSMEHVLVAHRDNGKRMFNFSEWLGTTSTVVLSNTYRPDNERGFGPAAQSVVYSVLQDMAFDALREFWPEISKKLKLPFRGQSDPPPPDLSPDMK